MGAMLVGTVRAVPAAYIIEYYPTETRCLVALTAEHGSPALGVAMEMKKTANSRESKPATATSQVREFSVHSKAGPLVEWIIEEIKRTPEREYEIPLDVPDRNLFFILRLQPARCRVTGTFPEPVFPLPRLGPSRSEGITTIHIDGLYNTRSISGQYIGNDIIDALVAPYSYYSASPNKLDPSRPHPLTPPTEDIVTIQITPTSDGNAWVRFEWKVQVVESLVVEIVRRIEVVARCAPEAIPYYEPLLADIGKVWRLQLTEDLAGAPQAVHVNVSPNIREPTPYTATRNLQMLTEKEAGMRLKDIGTKYDLRVNTVKQCLRKARRARELSQKAS